MSTSAARCVGGAVAVVMALMLAAPVSAANPDRPWRSLLDRAAKAAERTTYVGESLWVNYEDGEPGVSTFRVQSSGNGEISVTDRTRYAVRLGDDGGSLADHERGWFFPLPAADLAKAHKGLDRLAAKYRVRILGDDRLLDRPCTRLEITRKSDDRLVERLWIDQASDLLLRRETYAGEDELLRMVAYLRLDLDPVTLTRSGDDARPSRDQGAGQVLRPQSVTEIDEDGRATLREAGWLAPEKMPDGYTVEGAYAISGEESQALQLVYSDGLYAVSLFEQREGRLDPETLPEGAEITEQLGFPAYTWPGAVPRRLVWQSEGATWSLVGDAPPDELAAMAQSLGSPSGDSILQRIRRGLGRLWSWVSPWS